MIEAKKISKKYKGKVIFENVSLQLATGSITVITGSSGVGKTTLLNCLGQLESIDSGEIWFDNQLLHHKSKKRFFREYAGFLFQNFALIDNETVKQNLRLVVNEEEKMIAALRKFQMEDLLHQKVFRLSGGEQQRVALARLFLQRPKIVFADEPTASLDRGNRQLVIDALKELNKQGVTIVLVTHDLDLAEQLGGRVDMNQLLIKQKL
ncbi:MULTISPECIES: ATP-binding cassette domain-containing protein [unclassified Enterococcus]|uniref:ATP-binding cassette domain-containing protein n=1 Tax=unclassified Enterococcus TaxID=2608891 RepID=UPI001A90DF1D|nr:MULTISPECIES: ATP-binding cassette domain-containing protein [unclassified Enterococcus]MBO0461493.1 ATP-binding cassette domain-containing protein [Enterococcus sp. DIV1298c]MBO1298619.1 ATP-binding cassette domain-containing protein [Enterococcus sp. DIV1271a]